MRDKDQVGAGRSGERFACQRVAASSRKTAYKTRGANVNSMTRADWHDVSAPCPSHSASPPEEEEEEEEERGINITVRVLVAGVQDPHRCLSACPSIHQVSSQAENKHTIPSTGHTHARTALFFFSFLFFFFPAAI